MKNFNANLSLSVVKFFLDNDRQFADVRAVSVVMEPHTETDRCRWWIDSRCDEFRRAHIGCVHAVKVHVVPCEAV